MKLIGLFAVLFVALSITSGCASNKAEKEAYMKDGSMDKQVEAWKKPGGRY